MEKAKVLVVEDQRIISLEIKERVEDLGYEVIAIVKTGEQAVQFAKDLKPDLILMDIRLEGEMDGIEAAGIIKETIECPIIFLTAYADDKTIQRAKIAQPYGYIVKPLDERELRSAIEIALYKSSIEKKLKDSEIKYRTIVNTLEGFLYMVDEQYNLILSNLSLDSKIKAADLKGKKCYELIYKSKNVCRHCPLDLLKQGKTTRTEVFEPETVRWFYRVSTPLHLSEKKTYFQHLLVDITERKRNEENALNALNEKEVLLREIHHRVKNNLQLMLSLIRLQELNSSDKAVKTNLRAIENRLNSMVLVHENLYSASDLAKIPFKEYIDKLTAHLVRVFGMDVKNVNIKSEIDDIFMSIDYAIPLGIIINELITNSIKHAFSEGISGNIIIKFYKKDNNYFLEVIDDGSGLPENTDFDKPKALGMQIIKSLCSQLDGNASYSNHDGCHFNLALKNIDKASYRKT